MRTAVQRPSVQMFTTVALLGLPALHRPVSHTIAIIRHRPNIVQCIR